MTKAALPLLHPGASALTLTCLGAVRAAPYYNTMGLAKASLEASVRHLAESLGQRGIRANGISAGPIKTLAASGIKDFSKLLGFVAKHAPLRRNVNIEEVGNTAAFLLSDPASGITGEITCVDGGSSQVMAVHPETEQCAGDRYFTRAACRLLIARNPSGQENAAAAAACRHRGKRRLSG
jgi:enoyl-[acyl-carrier protein] reductase I